MQSERDPHYSSRVHSWVLVLKGKHDQPQDVFIEPTTGTIFDIDKSPYLGIESAWNELNYWANVQPAEKPPQVRTRFCSHQFVC